MTQGGGRRARSSTVRIEVQSADTVDIGVGIVLLRRPLTLLVPTHVLALFDEAPPAVIRIDGVPHEGFRVLPTPALEKDHLSVLRFPRGASVSTPPVRLTRSLERLRSGQTVLFQGANSSEGSPRPGRIVETRETTTGLTAVTDVRVAPGASGSALFVRGRLAAVCQGAYPDPAGGRAIAVQPSTGAYRELRRLSSSRRVSALQGLITGFLVCVLALAGFGVFSTQTFSLEGVEVAEDGSEITAINGQPLTLRPSWSRSFETPIRRQATLSRRVGAPADLVAVGTICEDSANGALVLLDALGRTVWTYSVPDGECIYSTGDLQYDRYLVDVICSYDLDQDGKNEVLAVFVHDHYFPCKLVVLDLSGRVLCEYWHHGYIRNLASGRLGRESEPITVLSASNNAMKTSSWNPQVLFAFRGLEISGQSPPYEGHGPEGSEIWYRQILNVEPERLRAKVYQYEFRDADGDGFHEVRVALTDSRFYYLDDDGRVLRVDVGDYWKREFDDAEAPPLVKIPLRRPAATGEDRQAAVRQEQQAVQPPRPDVRSPEGGLLLDHPSDGIRHGNLGLGIHPGEQLSPSEGDARREHHGDEPPRRS